VAPDGAGLTVLQASPYAHERDPRWTPDGQWLVFLEDGRITVTGADGFGRYHALQQFEVESLSLVP
jgi:Tol biopolymer transport system component